MIIETYQGPLEELKADLLIVILDTAQTLCDLGEGVVKERVEALNTGFSLGTIAREVSFDPVGLEVGTVVVYSTEMEKGYGLWENIKIFAARGLKLGVETGRPRVAVALNSAAGLENVARVVEGALLGSYRFDRYKKEPKKRFESAQLVLWTTEEGKEAAEAAIEHATTYAQAANLARDLCNEPASVMTPAALVAKARELESQFGLQLELWDTDRLVAENFAGLVAVGAGSKHPPQMCTLTYEPALTEGAGVSNVHLVLVGKGVTFDTGGISIKPGRKLHVMRADMSGAAAVLGAMQIIGTLKPEIKVSAIMVLAENCTDGESFRPGDIIVYRNGKSVHVDDTDAEGRMVVADGLIQAGLMGATHIVDIASLTSASERALGTSFSALMGNNRVLVNAVTRAGGNHGEAFWKLPLPAEYRELIRCPCADLNNEGGKPAGAILAGLFLQEFVPAGSAWAHLDIAPTFWRDKPWKYFEEGASGVGARTLADLAVNWKENTAK